MMWALRRSCTLLRAAVLPRAAPRAAISVKPAKNVVTPAEQVFALGVMFVTILGPSGWVLAHIEDYKKR